VNEIDMRHGTAAGYSAHRRAGETACAACKKAKASANKHLRDLEKDLALTGGSWQPRDGIMRWVEYGAAS
jgi:hypothetical protein